jgi:hypothetical protein
MFGGLTKFGGVTISLTPEVNAQQMKISAFYCYALTSCVAAAMLAGCGGSQPPIGAPGAMRQTSSIATHADRGKSWMLPEAKSEDLLYVSNVSNVVIFSYPAGKVVGELKGFSSNARLCVDSKGDVFATNFDPPALFEYAHGGSKRIATIKLPFHNGVSDCAFDPTTGNMAISDFSNDVRVFAPGKTKPKSITDPSMFFSQSCVYDSKGDLFVSGLADASGNPLLTELPKGSRKFVNIQVSAVFNGESDMHWDGTYIDLGTPNSKALLQFSISGSSGAVAGKVLLKGASEVVGFFIDDGTLILSNWRTHRFLVSNTVRFYKYPGGGAPTFKLSKDLTRPRGVVVSPAQ